MLKTKGMQNGDFQKHQSAATYKGSGLRAHSGLQIY